MRKFLEDEFIPRELSEKERECLFYVLPENKSGYLHYRKLISDYFVIGKAPGIRTGFLLSNRNNVIDYEIPPSPVFAMGSLVNDDTITDIVIYQQYEDVIEAEINYSAIGSNSENKKNSWSYSDWIPGNNSPEDGTVVKEIKISGDRYTLVIAQHTKRIWLHEKDTGINFIIPVTNYFNELMRYKNIRDPKIALNPKNLFTSLNKYSDAELSNALIMYDKYLKRFSLKHTAETKEESEAKNIISSLFRRKKN